MPEEARQRRRTIYRRADGRYEAQRSTRFAVGRRPIRVYARHAMRHGRTSTARSTRRGRASPVQPQANRRRTSSATGLRTSYKPELRPTTYSGYEIIVRRHITPVLGRKYLVDLTPADVHPGCSRRFGKGDQRAWWRPGTPSPRMVQLAHAVLRNALRTPSGRSWFGGTSQRWSRPESGVRDRRRPGPDRGPGAAGEDRHVANGALPVRYHDLRHTAVSLLLALGVPPHVVREIVVHSDIKVTMTVYAHGRLDEQAAALAQLGHAVAGALPSSVAVNSARKRSRRGPDYGLSPAEAEGFEPPDGCPSLAFKLSGHRVSPPFDAVRASSPRTA